ncbi:asparagine synthase-related protein [Azospirillum sp. sgz302134]
MNGATIPGATILGTPDPVLGWDGTRAYVTEDVAAGVPPPARLGGMAAAVQRLGGGGTRVFRDRLGLGKLFWVRDREGVPTFAARPAHLVRAGHAFDAIMALPRGCMVTLDERGRPVPEGAIIAKEPKPSAGASLAEIGARIRRELDAYIAAVAAAYPGRRAYLCLSGGLDSSTIAVVARRHFPTLTAVSFDLAGSGRKGSEDRMAARQLAADLGIPMVETTVTAEKLLSYLDLVLVEGIDWRDFNVHCGLVNAALAAAIVEDCKGDEAPLVVTGDLSNEFLVDYAAETYRGTLHYELPRLDPERLRAILVHGLDTCHREGGVFGAFGLTVVQPYAACVDAYLDLPTDFLRLNDRKERLVQEIVGSQLPDYIYRRPKVRAQIGDAHGGGTLAACIDNGIDGSWLRRRFAELHNVGEDKALDRFIRAGRYRAAVPAQKEQTHGDL